MAVLGSSCHYDVVLLSPHAPTCTVSTRLSGKNRFYNPYMFQSHGKKNLLGRRDSRSHDLTDPQLTGQPPKSGSLLWGFLILHI